MIEKYEALTQGNANLLHYGDTVIVEFGIAKGDWGSRSVDRNELSIYTAPLGMAILTLDVHKTGHHSSVSVVEVRQGGQLTYQTGILANLMETVTDGFLKGALEYKGKKIIGADATRDFTEFRKELQAHYRFAADTHATASFSWTTNTKTGRHGASIDAYAEITLSRVATANEAQQIIDVIKFAIQTGASEDVFELINRILTGEKGKETPLSDPVDPPDAGEAGDMKGDAPD